MRYFITISGIHYITEPTEYLEPKIGKSGFVIDVFRSTVAKHRDRPALCYKRAAAKVIRRAYIMILCFLVCIFCTSKNNQSKPSEPTEREGTTNC